MVKLTETMALESCLREYRDNDKMWASLFKEESPSGLKCGFDYWASVHDPWETQEKKIMTILWLHHLLIIGHI